MSTRCAAARPAVQDSAKEMVHPFAVRMSTIRAARVSVPSCLITYSIKMLLLAVDDIPGKILSRPAVTCTNPAGDLFMQHSVFFQRKKRIKNNRN